MWLALLDERLLGALDELLLVLTARLLDVLLDELFDGEPEEPPPPPQATKPRVILVMPTKCSSLAMVIPFYCALL